MDLPMIPMKMDRAPEPPLINAAFITGSHAYGIPTEESDVDLVMLVEPETLHLLVALFGDPGTQEDLALYNDLPTAQLRVGKLNLIVSTTVRHYRQWLRGTKALKAQAPVTREQACAMFKEIRAEGNK